MKTVFLSLLLLLSTPIILSAQDNTQLDQLQQQLHKDVADGQFVGCVAGFAKGNDFTVFSAGNRDEKTQLPFERTTLNRIASIAKSMTAVAALQLYEQGKIDLDEPIATYLPDYPRRHASQITTRMLLLHSSGIGAYKSGKEAQNQQHFSSLTEAASVFQDRDLVDTPGKAEHYTTYGYVVLGMVIEAVSGVTYEAYMQKNVWDVAGMKNTGVEHLSQSYENKSSLYHRTKKGKIRLSTTNDLSNRTPGGGLYSTADDLLKFGRAVLEHRLLSAKTFAMMMEEPGLPYDGNPYGMGWFLYGDNPKYGQVYGHTGEQTGCAAILLLLPEQDSVVLVMSNTAFSLPHVFGIAVGMFPLLENNKK